MKFHFYLRFHTEFGESLWICGNVAELGNDDPSQALPMQYLDSEFWQAGIEINRKSLPKSGVSYKYYLKNKDGELISEWGNDRIIDTRHKEIKSIEVVDTWNHAGEFGNSFYTAPFADVLLKSPRQGKKIKLATEFTHEFRIKAPLIQPHQTVCLLGNCDSLRNWSEENPIQLTREGNWWKTRLDLSGNNFPLSYKYGILDNHTKEFTFESGDNRLIYEEATSHKAVIMHDGFIRFPNNTWKGAGIAIPVFSLRSRNSFGVGEFSDLKLLVDWAKETGLKLIQILPVNDTIATGTWMDSYPYAAISAFALHPLYINLAKVAGKKHAAKVSALKRKQKQLNELSEIDYEEVIRFKLAMLRELYELMDEGCFESKEYEKFFEENRHWLEPYATFCYLRDKYGTTHFQDWKSHNTYTKEECARLMKTGARARKDILFYCFVQFHLHLQLKEASDYAHRKGIVLKG